MRDQTQFIGVGNDLWRCHPVKKDRMILLIVLLLATFFRFNNLGEPGFWLDEVAYTIAAQRPIISQIINPTDTLGGYLSVDPTLSAIPSSIFLKLGFLNFTARFPAALFGILGVAMLYKLGRGLFGNSVGLTASFLLCFSSFHILYSQEARSYTQFTFFTIGSFLFFYQATRNNQIASWIVYIFFTWAGVSTNHLMLFVIAAQGFFLSIYFLQDIFSQGLTLKILQIPIYFLGSIIIIYIFRAPWWQDFSQRQCAGCSIANPSYHLDLGKGVQSIEAFSSHLPLMTALLMTLCLVGLVFSLYRFPKQGVLLVCWLVLSILITTIGLWFIAQFFHPRYTIWGLPAFLLAVACGVVGLAGLVQKFLVKYQIIPENGLRFIKFIFVTLLIFPVVIGNWIQIQYNPIEKQNWPLGQLQEATTYIAGRANNQETVIGIPNTLFMQFYMHHLRPDLSLVYFDPGTKTLPQKLNSRWYVFYSAQHIPARWQTELDYVRFNDIVVVHQEKECQIEECMAEAKVLLEEYAEVHPNSAIEEKIKVILSGLSNLPH